MVLSPLLKGEESREEKKSKTDNPNKPKGPIRPEAFALVINALCSICLFYFLTERPTPSIRFLYCVWLYRYFFV